MIQSKKDSLIEATVNTLIGLLITFAVAPIIYGVLHVKMTLVTMGLSNLLFTVVSILRNYVIRRIFNRTNIFTYRRGRK